MSVKRWKLGEVDRNKEKRIAAEMGVSLLAAKVLLSRGGSDPEKAAAFIGEGDCSSDPFLLKDMDMAVARILAAVDGDELIAVFGDYDVDGLTATTLMYRCLSSLGARVVCSLPSRDDTGYGLSKEAIDSLAENGVTLIVTVDNGVAAFEEVEYASSIGVDTVITDHHVVRDDVPSAVAVVNPHRPGDISPFHDLAGVGVALKTAAALQGMTVAEAVEEYGLLAAIGTIADIMPLVDENRYIVKKGLAQFPYCDIPGLCALCETVGLDMNTADEADVSYTISPHLNAAGRMGNAELALKLLLTEDMDEAYNLASELVNTNDRRREEEQRSVSVINGILEQEPCLLSQPVIIVAGSEFHSGVMGIVCSRLVEQYNKPVIIISVDGDEARGSGRSIEGISLYGIIESCADMMNKFGGHEMAAGFTMDASRIGEFRSRVAEYCHHMADVFKLPCMQVDGEVYPGDVTEESVAGLRVLAPFGSCNKEPCFLVRNCTLAGVYRLGSGRNTRLMLKRDGEQFYAAYFGCEPDDLGYQIGDIVDVVLNYSIYTGHSRTMVSTKVADMRKSSFTEEDLNSYEEYRRFCFSGTASENASIRLDRNDVARVYRKIRNEGLNTGDDAAFAGEFCGMPLGRAAAAVDVLLELGFVEVSGVGGSNLITAVDDACRRELTESGIFMKLRRE